MTSSGIGPDPERIAEFSRLVKIVSECQRCLTMAGRTRLLSVRNGPISARVLFIAEAPGRLGGDRSGVPLTADRSGQNFERLLVSASLSRDQVFVTNVVLCNPRDARDRNRTPSKREIANCHAHLEAQLALVHAPIVATLGVTALRALDSIDRHGLSLRTAVGHCFPWQDRLLVPLYHPSEQAMISRPLALQREDYQRLGRFVADSS
ncbi:MAG TPA: uracil-DNA glycosylase [Chloroflexota bacterium]|nr:uracil-DNA glycosylase [Chloroflexota bacterium]